MSPFPKNVDGVDDKSHIRGSTTPCSTRHSAPPPYAQLPHPNSRFHPKDTSKIHPKTPAIPLKTPRPHPTPTPAPTPTRPNRTSARTPNSTKTPRRMRRGSAMG
ncbi:hypothetical protein SVIO_058840 [Streptomyces violaceusniger]|uniref:Uncharacterized protein n=1 Tax=Streptomyces violaceusniger TaxID=68280 RepID=A0A4D4L0Y8_STRVO|nr:hypothetical protein SVIO_058840 [Streptomyces violaceusniger]